MAKEINGVHINGEQHEHDVSLIYDSNNFMYLVTFFG